MLIVCTSFFSAHKKAAIFGPPQTAIIIAATYRAQGGRGYKGWRNGWSVAFFEKGKHCSISR